MHILVALSYRKGVYRCKIAILEIIFLISKNNHVSFAKVVD